MNDKTNHVPWILLFISIYLNLLYILQFVDHNESFISDYVFDQFTSESYINHSYEFQDQFLLHVPPYEFHVLTPFSQ